MPGFETFIGVDLGGGKGKNTAVARLERTPTGVRVVDYGTGKEGPWYDERLLAYLRQQPEALVAIDAPLTMPVCVRCTLPRCPTVSACEVPMVAWFRERAARPRPSPLDPGGELVTPSWSPPGPEPSLKPRYTTYTQRATEVLLHEEQGILPRETLGQGMGPLASRGLYLTRGLDDVFRLNASLIEVYPKGTLARLFSHRVASRYKRNADAPAVRLEILNALGDLAFAPGAWREDGLANDHKFDAILCAYTGYLFAEGRCAPPPDPAVAGDGWIWGPAAGVTAQRPPAA